MASDGFCLKCKFAFSLSLRRLTILVLIPRLVLRSLCQLRCRSQASRLAQLMHSSRDLTSTQPHSSLILLTSEHCICDMLTIHHEITTLIHPLGYHSFSCVYLSFFLLEISRREQASPGRRTLLSSHFKALSQLRRKNTFRHHINFHHHPRRVRRMQYPFRPSP